MQFKRLMADLIMHDPPLKTATRRLKEPRFKVGSLQPVQNGYRDKALCYVRIEAIYKQPMSKMTKRDVEREGFNFFTEFYNYICKINKVIIRMSKPLWVIEFHREDKTDEKI